MGSTLVEICAISVLHNGHLELSLVHSRMHTAQYSCLQGSVILTRVFLSVQIGQLSHSDMYCLFCNMQTDLYLHQLLIKSPLKRVHFSTIRTGGRARVCVEPLFRTVAV